MRFEEFLAQLDDGQVNESLGEQLRELTQAVNETGAAGTLTITLSLAREGNACTANVKVAMKKPTAPLHGTLFYFGLADPSTLTRRDERQQTLRGLEAKPLRNPSGPRRSMATEEEGDDNE